MESIKTYLNRPFFRHLLFWILVYSCYTISNLEYAQSVEAILVMHVFKVSLQAIIAYICLGLILPRYQSKKNKIEVGFLLISLLIIIQIIVVTWRIGYLETAYPLALEECINRYGHLAFWQRVFDFKVLFFNNIATYFPPLLILLALQYYQKQQKLAELNEQKTSAELIILKNQLNPHFLFNTLNNLYAMAVKKSDKTPEVIGKLSEILDYTLYGCNEKEVDLNKEIQLIENYLALEKVRYGKRVHIDFKTTIHQELKIAPLLFLTFIENAFKHGVREELDQAAVEITLTAKNNQMLFFIKNTIPKSSWNKAPTKEPIGLKNVKKQLVLLYPNAHELEIKETTEYYEVRLAITNIVAP